VKFSSTFSDGSFTDIKSVANLTRKAAPEEEKEEDGDGGEESDGDDDHDQKLFTCPVEGCVYTYQKYKWLENHLEYGQCKLIPEKESFFDKAKIIYSEKLTVGMSTQPVLKTTPCKDIVSEPRSLPQGWALKLSKRSVRFSDKHKTFLDEMFNRGKETGHKLDAATVAQEMRFAKDLASNRRFQVDEFLTPSQVQSYFSRKASKDRHSSEEEVVEVAEQEVDSLDAATEEQLAYTPRLAVPSLTSASSHTQSCTSPSISATFMQPIRWIS